MIMQSTVKVNPGGPYKMRTTFRPVRPPSPFFHSTPNLISRRNGKRGGVEEKKQANEERKIVAAWKDWKNSERLSRKHPRTCRLFPISPPFRPLSAFPRLFSRSFCTNSKIMIYNKNRCEYANRRSSIFCI